MPFQSEQQRRFMWAEHPEIAQRWTNEGKGYVDKNNDQIRRAAASRLAGVKASGKPNFKPKKAGGKNMPIFGVHGSRSTKEV